MNARENVATRIAAVSSLVDDIEVGLNRVNDFL